jgi:outer membrane receptor protein involved in Fe transport
MNNTTTRILAAASMLSLALGTKLLAQTAPASPPAEDTIKLETFTVNVDKDQGYIASDSLAGGRTNTPIKLTSASISSLTRTFLDDLGIQDVKEAMKWTSSVVPEDVNAGKGFGGTAFHDYSFNYRGASAGQQGGPGPTKNYFSFFQNADAYNIDRIEVLKGPNSIIFGLGTVGGQLSTYTKIPRFDKDFTQPTLIVDSHNSVRLELDVNKRIDKNLAIRINAVNDNHNDWRKGDVKHFKAADVSLLYKLGENTTLRLEGEYAKKQQTLISSIVDDRLSSWDGSTASNAWGANPTGSARTAGMNQYAWWNSNFWVYIPGLGSSALQNWGSGFAATSVMSDAYTPLHFKPSANFYPTKVKLPWESTYSDTTKIPLLPGKDWTYGAGQSLSDYKDYSAYLDHKVNENVDLNASFYRYTDSLVAKDYEAAFASVDINKQLPDGTTNPNFGKAYGDFFLSKQTQSHSVTEGRVIASIHFEPTLFGQTFKQVFNLEASQKDLKLSARQYLGQIANGASNWTDNLVWGRIYMDHPNQVMNAPETINGKIITYGRKPDGYWFDFDDDFKLNDYAIMSQSRFLDDALSVTLGARHDQYDENLLEMNRKRVVGPGGGTFDDPGHNGLTKSSGKGDTYSAGAVYFLKNGLGFVANMSKNIQPPAAGSQPYLNGHNANVELGKGFDYGLRYSSNDGRFYVTAVYYTTKSTNQNVENPIDFRGVWQKYNNVIGQPTQSGSGNMAFSDTKSLDMKGYEFEIVANPTKNWRLQATYGLPDSKIVNFYPAAAPTMTPTCRSGTPPRTAARARPEPAPTWSAASPR